VKAPKAGRPPKLETRAFALRLPVELWALLQEARWKERKPMNQIIIEALKERLK